MHEIVTVSEINHVFFALAIAAPLAGAALFAVSRQKKTLRAAAFLLGLAGPANLLLWLMYQALTSHLGLDSVKNLFVNLACFLLIGAAAGIGIGKMWPHNVQNSPVQEKSDEQ